MDAGDLTKRGRGRGLLRWTPWAALVAMLAATLLATSIVSSQAHEQEQLEFESAVRRKQDQISAQLHTYTSLLRAAAGMISAQTEVTVDEFRRFVAPLRLEELYPGLLGLGWTVRVPANELSAFLERARREYGPEFEVWPLSTTDDHFAIYALEPLDRRNRAALGYDMFTASVRREAMARARDTGLPATSGPVLLVQEIEPDKQTGFLTYVPVYETGAPTRTVEEKRRALRGFAYSPYRAGDLLSQIVTAGVEEVGFEVRDELADALLYRSDPVPDDPAFAATRQLVVNGRVWTLEYFALPAAPGASRTVLAWGVLLGGCLVSGLVFLFLRLQARAREAVAASEAHLRLVTDALPVLIAYLDPDLRYRLANKAYEVWFGTPQDALVGVRAYLASDQQVRARLHEALAGKTLEYELQIDTLIGRRVVKAIYVPDRVNGTVRGLVVLGYDVTLERNAQRERQLLLDREQRAREEAQAAVRVRDEFLSIASHELRTPLTTLKLLSDALGRQLGRGLPAPQLLPKMEAITRQVGRLARLVDELLDLSRVQAGRLELQPVDLELVDFTREILERFAHDAQQAGSPIRLEAPERLFGRWDPLRLDQVLTNLVSNALKYGAGKPVEVSVVQGSDAVTLSVRDHGIGIEPEHQARVFGRFERAVSERHYGGFGLGLWITRQIVESMDGSIRVESAPGKGARFIVELPLESLEPSRAVPGQPSAPIRA